MVIPFRFFLITGLLFIIADTCHLPGDNRLPLNQVVPTATDKPIIANLINQWSNEDLSLQYPYNFYKFNEIWPDLGDYIQYNPEYQTDEILNLGDGTPGAKDGYTYRIAVMQRPYTSDMDMESVYEESYSVVRLNYPEQEFVREDTTLAGKPAVQFTLQRPSGEPWWRLRDVWVIHRDSIYIFTYWTNPDLFEKGLPYFESFLASVILLE